MAESIENYNNKLLNIVNEFTVDIKDCITQFTEMITLKLNKQTEELNKTKKELESKTFDESNYNNVSITMNLSKQVKERDNKIRELEQRIKFIENKSNIIITNTITNSSNTVPVEIKEVVNEVVKEEEVIVENKIIEVESKPIKNIKEIKKKNNTKKTSVVEPIVEPITIVEPIV